MRPFAASGCWRTLTRRTRRLPPLIHCARAVHVRVSCRSAACRATRGALALPARCSSQSKATLPWSAPLPSHPRRRSSSPAPASTGLAGPSHRALTWVPRVKLQQQTPCSRSVRVEERPEGGYLTCVPRRKLQQQTPCSRSVRVEERPQGGVLATWPALPPVSREPLLSSLLRGQLGRAPASWPRACKLAADVSRRLMLSTAAASAPTADPVGLPSVECACSARASQHPAERESLGGR